VRTARRDETDGRSPIRRLEECKWGLLGCRLRGDGGQFVLAA
jgi:hypothetical protein